MSTTAEPPEPGEQVGGEAGLEVRWLGTVPYAEALELQRRRLEARQAARCRDVLLLLEHPPVLTLGRSANDSNLLASRAELAQRGIEVHQVSRGGDVTYHAPGQLVGYLIVDLAAREPPDVHRHVRRIEAGLMDALTALGVPSRVISGTTGVFVDDSGRPGERPPAKIASIGVGVRGWVTWHGFALNVSLDLSGFDFIIPCGLRHVVMTSVAHELGPDAPADLDEQARQRVAEAFSRHFG